LARNDLKRNYNIDPRNHRLPNETDLTTGRTRGFYNASRNDADGSCHLSIANVSIARDEGPWSCSLIRLFPPEETFPPGKNRFCRLGYL
jgi:hypothetical protein